MPSWQALKNTQKQGAQLILNSESHFLFALFSQEHRLSVSKKKNGKAKMCIDRLFYTKRLQSTHGAYMMKQILPDSLEILESHLKASTGQAAAADHPGIMSLIQWVSPWQSSYH
ncbi:hypothetical protein PAHAL_9G534500 [Panicum hallii]|uniref:Uncharacterized protein n=1 Tax=Panicum hallii TaxID=206008 RepID=A0A2S3ISI9_9POAL|nr:hypothetical protein PAHAL_9G534500 [Panicum hallii]